MALADPQSITYDSTPKDLARTGMGLMEGRFAGDEGKFSLIVSHTANSRYRHSVQLRMDEIVSNPLVPDQNVPVFGTVGFTINAPKTGLSNDQVSNLAEALVAWLTPTVIAQLVTGEN